MCDRLKESVQFPFTNLGDGMQGSSEILERIMETQDSETTFEATRIRNPVLEVDGILDIHIKHYIRKLRHF